MAWVSARGAVAYRTQCKERGSSLICNGATLTETAIRDDSASTFSVIRIAEYLLRLRHEWAHTMDPLLVMGCRAA